MGRVIEKDEWLRIMENWKNSIPRSWYFETNYLSKFKYNDYDNEQNKNLSDFNISSSGTQFALGFLLSDALGLYSNSSPFDISIELDDNKCITKITIEIVRNVGKVGKDIFEFTVGDEVFSCKSSDDSSFSYHYNDKKLSVNDDANITICSYDEMVNGIPNIDRAILDQFYLNGKQIEELPGKIIREGISRFARKYKFAELLRERLLSSQILSNYDVCDSSGFKSNSCYNLINNLLDRFYEIDFDVKDIRFNGENMLVICEDRVIEIPLSINRLHYIPFSEKAMSDYSFGIDELYIKLQKTFGNGHGVLSDYYLSRNSFDENKKANIFKYVLDGYMEHKDLGFSLCSLDEYDSGAMVAKISFMPDAKYKNNAQHKRGNVSYTTNMFEGRDCYLIRDSRDNTIKYYSDGYKCFYSEKSGKLVVKRNNDTIELILGDNGLTYNGNTIPWEYLVGLDKKDIVFLAFYENINQVISHINMLSIKANKLMSLFSYYEGFTDEAKQKIIKLSYNDSIPVENIDVDTEYPCQPMIIRIDRKDGIPGEYRIEKDGKTCYYDAVEVYPCYFYHNDESGYEIKRDDSIIDSLVLIDGEMFVKRKDLYDSMVIPLTRIDSSSGVDFNDIHSMITKGLDKTLTANIKRLLKEKEECREICAPLLTKGGDWILYHQKKLWNYAYNLIFSDVDSDNKPCSKINNKKYRIEAMKAISKFIAANIRNHEFFKYAQAIIKKLAERNREVTDFKDAVGYNLLDGKTFSVFDYHKYMQQMDGLLKAIDCVSSYQDDNEAKQIEAALQFGLPVNLLDTISYCKDKDGALDYDKLQRLSTLAIKMISAEKGEEDAEKGGKDAENDEKYRYVLSIMADDEGYSDFMWILERYRFNVDDDVLALLKLYKTSSPEKRAEIEQTLNKRGSLHKKLQKMRPKNIPTE